VRVKKTTDNGTTETILYINQYYEKNLTTGEVTTYYYLGSRLVASKQDTDLRYHHKDHLTGTSLMTDTNGEPLGAILYRPFGETRGGSVPTDKLFTGQRLDDTGLYYYGARYYDPGIGRFISADTIVQDTAYPQAFNSYTYVFNNPLKHIDPTGHIVDLQDDPTIKEAWYLFAETAPDIALMMVESDIIFTIGWDVIELGENQAGTMWEEGSKNHVLIALNSGLVEDDVKAVAYHLSHESVHTIAFDIDPGEGRGGGRTKYEETIANRFMFWFGREIGYKPPEGAHNLEIASMKVNLGKFGQNQSNQLEKAYENTGYRNFAVYPINEKGEVDFKFMNELLSVFDSYRPHGNFFEGLVWWLTGGTHGVPW
jgi:RHS repeat-associated protein